MNDLIEKINSIPNLYHLKGCTDEQIDEAEKMLGIIFPAEYVAYVKNFGAISFYGTEWTGLNVAKPLNVVEATLTERARNASFPKDCFVLENQAIDGIITVADQSGKVYLQQFERKEKLCDSLHDYLDICIRRNVS